MTRSNERLLESPCPPWTTVAAALALMASAVPTAAASAPDDWTIHITVDNRYAIYFGGPTATDTDRKSVV